MKKSIIQDEKECYVCHTIRCLEKHHVFNGTASRKKSDHDGLTIWLCNRHHTGSNYSVHQNQELDLLIKKRGQLAWERKYGTREEFLKRYGKNYMEEL